MKRRAFLGAAASLALAPRVNALAVPELPQRAPVLYVAHGGPNLAVSRERGGELRAWGAALEPPRGVLAVTPHVRSRGLALSAIGPGRALISFPRQFLPNADRFRYATPDNAALVERVAGLLEPRGPVARGRAGLNHTVWQPMMHLRPQADVPIVELALPFGTTDAELFAIGQALAPLRDEGVWILCSGNLTHNLGQMRVGGALPDYARRFDEWTAGRLEALDFGAVVDWRNVAPNPYLAHPDDGGHFDVLLVGLGAAADGARRVTFPVEGWEAGGLSKRSVQID